MEAWAAVAANMFDPWAALAEEILMEAEEGGMGSADHGAPGEAGEDNAHAMRVSRPEVSQEVIQQLAAPPSTLRTTAYLQPTFDVAAAWIEAHPADKRDDCVQKLYRFYVEAPSAIHASKQVVGQLIGEPAAKIEPALSTFSDVYLHLDRAQRLQLERALAQSSAVLLQYLELTSYDETPMRVAHKHRQQSTEAGLQTPAKPQNPASSTASGAAVMPPPGKTTNVVKLFATDNRYAALIRTPASSPGGATGHYLITGSSLTTLQLLERVTGVNIKTALAENQTISEHAERYRLKTRVCTSDLAGANLVAEQLMMRDRDASWTSLHIPCHVHLAARVHGRVFALVEEDLRGLINFSLSLGCGAALSRFRRSLTAVLMSKDKIIFKPGRCSADAQRYRSLILYNCVGALQSGRGRCPHEAVPPQALAQRGLAAHGPC